MAIGIIRNMYVWVMIYRQGRWPNMDTIASIVSMGMDGRHGKLSMVGLAWSFGSIGFEGHLRGRVGFRSILPQLLHAVPVTDRRYMMYV